MNVTTIPLLDPRKAPYRGFASYPDPTALESLFAAGDNVRADRGVADLRAGTTGLATTPPTGATSYRASAVVDNGDTAYWVCVALISSTVGVFVNQYTYSSGLFGGWVEATAASGKYGATRMTDTGKGTFSVSVLPSDQTYSDVIVQNGSDDPRRIDLNGLYAVKIQSLSAPTQAKSASPDYKAKAGLTMSTGTGSTTSTLTNFTIATNDWNLVAAASPAVADKFRVVEDAHTVTIDGKQAWVAVDLSDLAYLTCCKWSLVSSGGTKYLVHDPTTQDNVTLVPASGVFLLAFDMSQYLPTGLSSIAGLEVEVVRSGLSANATATFYGVFSGGNVPGLAQYAVAWRNASSKAESPGVVLKPTTNYSDTQAPAPTPTALNKDGTVTATHILVRQGSSGYAAFPGLRSDTPAGFGVPTDPRLYYSVSVPSFSPSSTDGGRGYVWYDVYRADNGDDAFSYVGTQQTNDYTAGNWTYLSPFTAWSQKQSYTDNLAFEDKDTSRKLPSEFNEPVPVGTCGGLAGSRYLVGTPARASSSAVTGSVKVSASDSYYRFQSVSGDDTVDGGWEARTPGETPRAVFAVASSTLGYPNVYALCDKSLFTLDPSGGTVYRLAGTGTRSPRSVAERHGQVTYLDDEMVLRDMGSGFAPLSRLSVHDILTGVSYANAKIVSCARYRERLFLAYSDSGSANTKVLVYNFLLGAWESRDTFNASAPVPQDFVPWVYNGFSKLCFWTSDCKLYEYGVGTQDAGGYDIALSLTTSEVRAPGTTTFSVVQSDFYTTAATGKTATVTRTAKKTGATATGTNDLNAESGETRVATVDFDSSGVRPGVDDVGVQLTFSATVSSPFTLYYWGVEVEGGTGYGSKA